MLQIELRGLERLSFRERQVVMLKETGQSAEKIAKRLGISTSSVATLFNRARNKGYQVVAIIPEAAMGLGQEDEEMEPE
jgi:DNA-directed RNA polymerase specialized sigma24 family protein